MKDLQNWPTVQKISLSGSLERDAAAFLCANKKPKTAEHSLAVSRVCRKLADRFGTERETAVSAGLLHDISGVLKPQEMMDYAEAWGWEIDAAERAHPFLLHQRLSAVLAEKLFSVKDPAVLSAIACHTTLKGAPSDTDMILFLADKLAWDQGGTPPFAAQVTQALDHSLPCACRAYIRFVWEHGMILSPHRWLLEAEKWLEAEKCRQETPAP